VVAYRVGGVAAAGADGVNRALSNRTNEQLREEIREIVRLNPHTYETLQSYKMRRKELTRREFGVERPA